MTPAVRDALSDPASRITLRRGSALLLTILVITLLASDDRMGTFATLCALYAFISIGFALLLRESPRGAGLNRWDEALAFAALWLCVAAL